MSTPSRSIFATLLLSLLSSCTTAYDAYGRPHQVVTPGGALLGAAAVGLLAYGLASDDDDDDCRDNRSGYYRNGGNYRGSSYRNWNSDCDNHSRYRRSHWD